MKNKYSLESTIGKVSAMNKEIENFLERMKFIVEKRDLLSEEVFQKIQAELLKEKLDRDTRQELLSKELKEKFNIDIFSNDLNEAKNDIILQSDNQHNDNTSFGIRRRNIKGFSYSDDILYGSTKNSLRGR